eukprot:CAMPEP_0183293338 /NCGR_PEP_ID=MMETSP0160_2-20130417/2056_1 /TAXON_ID=2839 ORGANISM="Odontella Sinensis, Strain Grunow 1884" /NCGR_SAMPLE_ID=MMETSP0160_2 /ASSEMBLY_ACC=CAM_ASM_000250 /LENGTH=497 /DNA_ID=CAMNT_0025454437 /DNA_START=89 /DNA_END=1582 /DNA_ORIENTATION=-
MSMELEPLRVLLDSILGRLCVVEGKVGVPSPARVPYTGQTFASAASPASADGEDEDEAHPALTAYDEHVNRVVTPLAETCDVVGLGPIGPSLKDAWAGIRTVVLMGTKCKKPSGEPSAAIAPHLKPVQEAITKIRTVRLDRKFDWHIKAVMEMLAVCSWVVMSPPSGPTPTSFVKEAKGSSEFWSNKIRKEFKAKDDDNSKANIKFCDQLRDLIADLAKYCKEYHLSGLGWNPRGIDVKDYDPEEAASPVAAPKPAAPAAPKPAGGGIGGVMAELAKKRTVDGASAATGLKKVTREQQTWRKEYKKDGSGPPVPSPAPAKVATPAKMAVKKKAPPVLEYQNRGHKWAVENQTKESAGGQPLEVQVTDPKQQVYLYRCEGVTVKVTGKVKNVVLDECSRVGVVFETAISAVEIVNCKSVQVQSTGTVPTFSIDKTDGCLLYLTKESAEKCSFVTSKSSEMNVSWEDENGEVKEAPIPEQFQHRLVNGSVTSEVSDLYH